MDNPYPNFLAIYLSSLIGPTSEFFGLVVGHGVQLGIGALLGRYQAAVLTLLVVSRVASGNLAWRLAGLQAACLCLIHSLQLTITNNRVLSSYILINKITMILQPLKQYFQFEETDERNLGLVISMLPQLTGFLVAAAIPSLLCLLWRHIWSLSIILAISAYVFIRPGIFGHGVFQWLSGVAVVVLKFSSRAYFSASDTSIALCHTSSRKIESWEDRRSKASLSIMPLHEYQPLDPLRKEIRILRLLRRTGRPELLCEFIRTLVDDAPPFEAVSYTWGGESMSEAIVVDGQRLSVTPTVASWLRYRRSFFSEAFLWIDAVCINQKDQKEKTDQILLMQHIYARSTRTIVWLGRPAEVHDSYEARSLIMTLCALTAWEASLSHLQYVVSTDRNIESVLRLLCRSYFNRIWIVQEIALAKNVHIAYGNVVMNWESLLLCVSSLRNSRLIGSMSPASRHGVDVTLETFATSTKHLGTISSIADARRAYHLGERMSISDALARLEGFAATIPHDNIYGFLGLVDILPNFLQSPGYEVPVEQLYARITKHLLRATKNPLVLQFAGSGFPKRLEGLPSWVPDLSQGYIGRRKRWDFPSTSSSPSDELEEANNTAWNVLEIKHCTFDTIKTIQTRGLLISPNDFDSKTHGMSSVLSESSFTETLTRAHITDFLAWHDEALALAQSTPLTLEQYPGEVSEAVFRTISCNDPEMVDRIDGEETGIVRYKLIMTVVRAIYRLYDENIEDKSRTHERLLEETNIHPTVWASTVLSELNHFFFRLGASSCGKQLCVMESGRMGMVPPGSKSGDRVTYIRDQIIPFVLRHDASVDSAELIGGCYVYGVPDEPINVDNYNWDTQSII